MIPCDELNPLDPLPRQLNSHCGMPEAKVFKEGALSADPREMVDVGWEVICKTVLGERS